MAHPSTLIVGDPSEVHAVAVARCLENQHREVMFLDAASLPEQRWRWGDSFEMFRESGWEAPSHGWFRRLAPPGHHTGVEIGSLRAAEIGARLALLSTLSDAPIIWLTDYWTLMRAENKLHQYHVAGRRGIPVPETSVLSHAMDLPQSMGQSVVLKPLGVGDYVSAGGSFAVHASLVDRRDPLLAGLSQAPFLVQRRVDASAHLRVVTVKDRAWTGRLEANGLPLDWREAEEAHPSWSTFVAPEVEDMAIALAQDLDIGYSSQDWIVDHSGTAWFVDANPAGQWLFLPPEIATGVTNAVAAAVSSEEVTP